MFLTHIWAKWISYFAKNDENLLVCFLSYFFFFSFFRFFAQQNQENYPSDHFDCFSLSRLYIPFDGRTVLLEFRIICRLLLFLQSIYHPLSRAFYTHAGTCQLVKSSCCFFHADSLFVFFFYNKTRTDMDEIMHRMINEISTHV